MASARDRLNRRYEIEALLGEGGLGLTYRARDLLDGQVVTLKLLRSPSSENGALLWQEFQRLTGVFHPNLSNVLDFGRVPSSDGSVQFYLTTRHIPGQTLDAFASGRPSVELAGPLRGALQALAFMHAAGVCHGDFKPSNVIVDAAGDGTLIDLSAASALGTASNRFSGTPEFVAPERWRGPATRASDYYGVGVTLDRLTRRAKDALPSAWTKIATRLVSADTNVRETAFEALCELLEVDTSSWASTQALEPPFVGREQALGAFDDWLSRWRRGVGSPTFWVHGSEGVGRTRFLQECKWRAQASVEALSVPRDVAGGIAAALGAALGAPATDGDFQTWVERIANPNEGEDAVPAVLVLDDVDDLDPDQSQLLLGLQRALEPGSRYALVCASRTPAQDALAEVEQLPLAPLSRQDLNSWLGRTFSEVRLDQIWASTGGFPAEVRALERDAFSALAVKGSATGQPEVRTLKRRLQAVDSLPIDQQQILALLALRDGWLRDSSEVAADALAALADRGWIRRDDARWRLTRLTDAGPLRSAVPSAQLVAVRTSEIQHLRAKLEDSSATVAERGQLAAALTRHLADATQFDDAKHALLEHEALWPFRPHGFASALEVLALARPDDIELLLVSASLWEAAGQPVRAREPLVRVLRRRPPLPLRTRARLQAARTYLRGGSPGRALAVLEHVRRTDSSADKGGLVSESMSLALLKRGEYLRALDIAENAFGRGADGAVDVGLSCTAAMAASYTGDDAGARTWLGRARAALGPRTEPEARLRFEGARALVAFRAADLSTALEGYRNALHLTERADLQDHAVRAALNYGTACHQAGAWQEARSAYQRGLALARALGLASTELTLRHNIARLELDLGRFEQAERDAERAYARATQEGHVFMQATCHMLLGEVALGQGRSEEARAHLQESHEAFEREGAQRELAETELSMAQLESNDERAAHRWLEMAAKRAEPLVAPDLQARIGLLRGRQHADAGELNAALRTLETALDAADQSGQRLLTARIASELGTVADRAHAPALAERHRSRARELLERVTAGLDPEVAQTFWQHPERNTLVPPAPVSVEPESGQLLNRFRRLLEINRRLNSAQSTDEILREALDAAIELTRSERGFLILTHAGKKRLSVPVARNLDRERVGKSHLKFSHGIAERVIRSGEPVVTSDASTDLRFESNGSVHAMGLRSILCVPIRSATGVLGAVYLDNRLRSGGYEEQDVELLLALSDQVALTMARARMIEELSQRTDALARAHARAEALVAGQAEEIGRLESELARQRVPEQEHPTIIGTSDGVRRVLARLERVAKTDLTVLIEGESGTGKELVARALHDDSDRKQGPFVAINCAALPESLLEAELFGYQRGAFTGAARDHDGLFVAAEGGTLFMDEVAEMSPAMQVKLLRVLQEREVRALGATRAIKIHVRMVCASHKRLSDEVQSGRFREDLFYRLAVVELALPPLRERADDILPIAEHLLRQIAEKAGRPLATLAPDAARVLLVQPWPGNVRQLENVLQRASVLCDGSVIRAADLELAPTVPTRSAAPRRTHKREHLRSALEATDWNVSEAARRLRISRATLYRKMQHHGLSRAASDRA